MASVTISDITKDYGSVRVMHGVNVAIKDGEFVILVGPSGCGKSTLLRMVAGLEPITDGTISIGDRVVNDVAPKDRNIAMVFQTYALYPHKTVAENMGFSLYLAGRSKREIDREVRAAAEILDLMPLLDRYPKALSGGQRQRVAMGRAIVRNPQVFLFDEPLSNLDAKLRVQMRTEIKALHKRLKTTIVYVTHDQVEAMTMADRIIVMNKGQVEQSGAPLELYDNPANLFVAGFIGSPAMNLLEGKIDGMNFTSKGGVSFAVSPALVEAGRGKNLVAGIRPEHIVLATNGLECRVIVDEPTGAETLFSLSLGGDTIHASFRERLRHSTGASLVVAFPPQNIHLFDQATGRRLEA